MNVTMRKILINLPDDVHQALKIAAVTEKRPQYQITQELIQEYLIEKGFLSRERVGGNDE